MSESLREWLDMQGINDIKEADLMVICWIKEHGTDEQKALLDKWREQQTKEVEG